jgi:Uma2 family endonuclease
MATHPEWKDPPPSGRMSEQEFHALEEAFPDEHFEYLDGIAYMMAGGTDPHEQINQNLIVALRAHLSSGPCRVRGPNRQTLVGTKKSGKKHYLYPDVVVSCNPADFRRDSTFLESPRLVIEILSPSTEDRDRERGSKFNAYRKCPTIQEIVLVDQFTPTVEVYRRNGEDGETWSYVACDKKKAVVEFASINLKLKMEDIYWDVNFDDSLAEEE